MTTKCEALVDAFVDDTSVCTTDNCMKTVTVNFIVPDCNTKADAYFDLSVKVINVDTGVKRVDAKHGLLEHVDGGAKNIKIEYHLTKGEKMINPVELASSNDCNCFE